jgi:ATP-dependent Clp protease protease subunit
MATQQTELSDQLIYGIDLKARRIHFGVGLDHTEENPGMFSGASVELAIRAIHKMIQEAPNKPIEIHMNSYGGDAYSMMYLMDVILSSPCQFKFFGGGAIMSSATWIMAVCDERWLYPNATILIHDGYVEGTVRNTTDHQIDAKENKRLQDRLNTIYAENSRMPKEFWDDIVQRDLYLTAEEAIMFGLADKLVEYKKRGNLRKSRQGILAKQPESKEFKKLIKNVYDRIERVSVPNISLNVAKKEESDPKVIVDDTPVVQPEVPVVEPEKKD